MEVKTKEKAPAEAHSDIGMQKMSVSTFLMRYNAIIILALLDHRGIVPFSAVPL